MNRFIRTVLLAILSTAPVHAEATKDVLPAFISLEGHWTGNLFYLDYQSNERTAIGMAASVETTPDANFVISNSRFTDPGFDVFILTVATIDPETGDYLETYHRGRNIEHFRYDLKAGEHIDAGWQYILKMYGDDDNRPALIRRTFTLNGDTYSQLKEIDFQDDEDVEFVFRNEVILTRTKTPVNFDYFRKQ